MSRLVLGLTGTNGAGKTAAADYLRSHGFEYLSLSDEIRHELRAQGLEPTREHLIQTGNRLRRKHGHGVLAQRVLARMSPRSDYVVDSIRNPAEVRALQAEPAFHLVHIDAPLQVRYERACSRGDERVPKSFEQFVDEERRELESADPAKQQLAATWGLAETTIENAGELADLEAAMSQLLNRFRDDGSV